MTKEQIIVNYINSILSNHTSGGGTYWYESKYDDVPSFSLHKNNLQIYDHFYYKLWNFLHIKKGSGYHQIIEQTIREYLINNYLYKTLPPI